MVPILGAISAARRGGRSGFGVNPIGKIIIATGRTRDRWFDRDQSPASAIGWNANQGDIDVNADDLRAIQAPLKQRYREHPEAALITLRAQGKLGEGITCNVETGKALVRAGLHPAGGGTGLDACSGDMLLEALVACAGVTLKAVATALGIELREAQVQAEGDLDIRGTLGLSKEAPVGFRNIRLKLQLDTDASEEQLASLLRLTERYCVIYQTLAHPPALSVTRQIGKI
jgi:uncharacterized OsmC-like protein